MGIASNKTIKKICVLKCCEVARSMVETRLAATRSAAALSLGIDEYDLDKKFARNCVEERITTLQDKVRLANQQMQGIQGEQTLLHFTLSQLRGQKSNKTALSKDQQVELLLSARRVIQKIEPAPERPASGSVQDTCIDADTLMLQVRLRLSACMREHDLSLKHNSILGSQLRKHALFRPLGSPYPTSNVKTRSHKLRSVPSQSSTRIAFWAM